MHPFEIFLAASAVAVFITWLMVGIMKRNARRSIERRVRKDNMYVNRYVDGKIAAKKRRDEDRRRRDDDDNVNYPSSSWPIIDEPIDYPSHHHLSDHHHSDHSDHGGGGSFDGGGSSDSWGSSDSSSSDSSSSDGGGD